MSDAQALSLGRITVQSALGEALRAEVEILDINAEEAASLSTRVASPEAFKKAGLEFNPAMSGLRATLLRRTDGRAYIKLSSDRVVSEPFVDVILETSWNTGRIVRDYTMLFDPPGMRSTQVAPAVAQLPTQQRTTAAPIAPKTQAAPRDAVVTTPLKPTVEQPKPVMTAATPKLQEPARSPNSPTLTVKPGDTAGRIAAANKPASVSLDQMLVALLKTNPDAFIQNNVNRIRAGAIVTLPSEEQASAMSPEQATQTIVAQSQDFNDFRRKFAEVAPTAQVAPSSREVSGKIQASVDDKKTAAGTPDKLTLSKGTVQGKSNEEQLAQARIAKEAAARAAELSKNLSDLNKLAAASGVPAAKASAASPSPTTPAVSVAAVNAAAQVVSMPASVPTPTSAVASAPVAAPAKPAVVPMPMPVDDESGLLADMLANPLIPAGALGLLALLGFGVYRAKQRKKASQMDSSFFESRLRPDSFSGASGGQSVDTSDNLTTGSSMVYSPSQLDAVDDVDPVAEADVYLAYGRDLQAEEILKDALRTNSQRLAIHLKLLEIYAKRRDAKAFEAIAALAFNLTDGAGPDWGHICEKGLAIDPDNALYLPGGQPMSTAMAATIAAPMVATSPAVLGASQPAGDALESAPAASSVDLDLDLDFSLDEPANPAPEVSDAALEQTEPTLNFGADTEPSPEPEAPAETPDFSFELPEVAEPLPTISDDLLSTLDTEPAPITQENEPSTLRDNLDPPEPELTLEFDELAPEPAPADAASNKDTDLMSFDLGSLSLELGEDPVTEPGAFVDDSQDPLETKLALAEEFRAIGDDDGARALIEEVIAESSGFMKAKAERALSKL